MSAKDRGDPEASQSGCPLPGAVAAARIILYAVLGLGQGLLLAAKEFRPGPYRLLVDWTLFLSVRKARARFDAPFDLDKSPLQFLHASFHVGQAVNRSCCHCD